MVGLGEADLVGISIAWLVVVESIEMLFEALLAVGIIPIGVLDELQATVAKMNTKDRRINPPRILRFFTNK